MKSEKLRVKSKKNSEEYKFKEFGGLVSARGITLITLVITIILLIILAGVTINLTLGENRLFNKTKYSKEKYEIESIREKVETEITNIEIERIKLNEPLTIEGALQEMVESGTFESIDKETQIGNIGEYEVKLKYNEENKVVIENIEKATGIRTTYKLTPIGYTKENKVSILLKVEGKVKSVTKPDGLTIYPEKEKLGIDYDVTANGTYPFIIEDESGNKQTKNAIVDTIDTLPPKAFEITAETTRTGGIKITAKTEDTEANETSVKSGIDRYEYYVKLSTASSYTKYDTNEITSLPSGTYKVYAVAYDKAENNVRSTNEVEVQVEEWLQIWNEQDLRNMANDLTKNYIIMQDIELTQTWTPIGNDYTHFTGKLEGNYHKITNLNNGNSSAMYQGLFGYIGKNGKVSNLSVEGVITGSWEVGILAGYNREGTIENVKVSGTVTGNGDGYYVGGLTGYNEKGTIQECYSNVEVTANGLNVGGLVGDNSSGTIKKCASIGAVKSRGSVGGLVGDNTSGTIENCYSTGTVTSTGGTQYTGGLIGYSYKGIITNVYTISLVKPTGTQYGGLIGYSYQETLTKAYWSSEKAGITTSAGGTNLTLEQMHSADSYAGFDFTSGEVWKMGEEYPELIFSPELEIVQFPKESEEE